MINLFATLIINHEYTGKTVGDYPEHLQPRIIEALKKRGYDRDGNPLEGVDWSE